MLSFDLNGFFSNFSNLFHSILQFDARKMGNSEVSTVYRDELEQDLINLRSKLTQRNKRQSYRYGYGFSG